MKSVWWPRPLVIMCGYSDFNSAFNFLNFGDWEATFLKFAVNNAYVIYLAGCLSYKLKLLLLSLQDPPLAADLKGEAFCALLGTHCRYKHQS